MQRCFSMPSPRVVRMHRLHTRNSVSLAVSAFHRACVAMLGDSSASSSFLAESLHHHHHQHILAPNGLIFLSPVTSDRSAIYPSPTGFATVARCIVCWNLARPRKRDQMGMQKRQQRSVNAARERAVETQTVSIVCIPSPRLSISHTPFANLSSSEKKAANYKHKKRERMLEREREKHKGSEWTVHDQHRFGGSAILHSRCQIFLHGSTSAVASECPRFLSCPRFLEAATAPILCLHSDPTLSL